MRNQSFGGIKGLLLAGTVLFCAGETAQAATVATYNAGSFRQSGNVLNSYSQTMIGFQIDLIADSGSPPSGVWDNAENGPDLPVSPTYSNPVGLVGNTTHFFTVTWNALSVAPGAVFSYSGLGYDAWTGSAIVGSPCPGDTPPFIHAGCPALTGNELITVFFANGQQFSAFLPAGGGEYIGSVNINAIPLPGALPLMGAGLAALGLLGWRGSEVRSSKSS